MTERLREFFSEIGKLGGSKGGKRTAEGMTQEELHVRAVRAAAARWADPNARPPKKRGRKKQAKAKKRR